MNWSLISTPWNPSELGPAHSAPFLFHGNSSDCESKENPHVSERNVQIDQFTILQFHNCFVVFFSFYLLLSPLCCSWHCTVASVLIYSAQIANTCHVWATVDLHQLVVLSAHLLLQWDCSWDQLVGLQHRNIVVRLKVSWTVGCQTSQARHWGFVRSEPAAEITGNICWAGTGQSSTGRRLLGACLL